MIRFLLLILFAISLNASNLLTYNIYERTDRVDIMLSFDAPYEGKIYQKKDGDNTVLTLEDLYFDQSVQRTLQSHIIQALSLESSGTTTVATLYGADSFSVVASKTVDGFGLRIRARLNTPQSSTTASQPLITPRATTNPNATDVTNDSLLIDGRYWSVMGVLALLLIVLLWVKRRVVKIGSKPLALGWSKQAQPSGIKVLFQKPLDTQNRVVLLEFGTSQYLILTGSSNTLLERFGQAQVQDEREFKTLFEQNRQKLDEYLRLQQTQLNAYKEKASQEFTPSQK
jgi:flagellar biogenesis protein FliO